MSIETASNRIPEEALNAFLDGILAELKSPPDPVMLTRVRAIFRNRIPLHMRSYAASLLILRAAGIARAQPQKPAVLPASEKQKAAPSPRPVQAAPDLTAARKRSPSAESGGSMVPLFVSMGKRQRLRPQELRSFISEKTGIPSDELGRVHLFDNYSFIDIPESRTETIIATVDGSPFKGRTIEIKPAKKKNEGSQEKEQGE